MDPQTVAGVLGNVFEWYDFALYGYFSDIIAQVFFRTTSDSSGLLWSYAVFGTAFLVRPIGGMIAGHIGDSVGRKDALTASLVLMAIPTFAMGFLPSYEEAGWLSTTSLVICRLFQGMSVGGQLPASIVYTVERQPKEHWGYYGAMVSLSSGSGVLLGNIVGAIIRSNTTEAELIAWGWRIPFLTSILVGIVAIVSQIYVKEHNTHSAIDEFGVADEPEANGIEMTPSRSNPPLIESLKRENLPALFSSALVPMLGGAGYYVSFVWMAIYMETMIHTPVKGAFWINAVTSFLGCTIPSVFTGWLSDSYGRTKTMMIGAISTGIFAPLLLQIISTGESVPAFFAQLTIGFLLSFYVGPLPAWLGEKFPPEIRLTSGAMGYNIAICTSSAFSPLIATALVHNYGPLAPGVIYPFFALLSIFGLLGVSKNNDHNEYQVEETEERTEPHMTNGSLGHLL